MLGVDPPLGLGVDADRLRADQEAHDVEVVRREVDDDPDVADAGRERARAAWRGSGRCARARPSARRRRSSRMAGLKRSMWPTVSIRPASAAASIMLERLLAGGRDRLLDQHVGAGAQRRHRHRQVQAGRRHDADEVELLLGEHALRVLVAARAPAVRSRAARRPDRDRRPPPARRRRSPRPRRGRGCAPSCRGRRRRRAAGGRRGSLIGRTPPRSRGPSSAAVTFTASITVATSSSVSDGWTGMLSTCSVSRSVTG